MTRWHILTGEYPPQPGGVSDYTRQIARGLAASGDSVEIWAPPVPGDGAENEAGLAPEADDRGITVWRLPDRFGPRSLARLNAALKASPGPHRLLVQYVPHAFGFKAMNVPFCLWLRSRRRDEVWVMFHEVASAYDASQPIAHRVIGLVTHRMAAMLARRADRIFVTIPYWERLLRRLVPGLGPIGWLPVPCNVPVADDPAATAEIRARYAPPSGSLLGHFGTYSGHIAPLLVELLPPLLASRPDLAALLLGRGGDRVADDLNRRFPDLAGRLHATGSLSPAELSTHLLACDLMVQPFPEGVSTRRTSTMAALAHGRPIVTTRGIVTEPVWSESQAVALAPADDPAALADPIRRLLDDPAERHRLGEAARNLYRDRFDLAHTIAALRGEPAEPLVPVAPGKAR